MEVKDDDLGLMLACTVRYAMGRRSYIVGTAADFVRTYQAALRKDQIAQLGREVREKLAWYESDGHPMGDDVDHRRWQRIYIKRKSQHQHIGGFNQLHHILQFFSRAQDGVELDCFNLD